MTKELYIFFQIEADGLERIATHKNQYDQNVPLVYFSRKAIENDKMMEEIQRKANHYCLTFELRVYQCDELGVDTFRPFKKDESEHEA